MSIDQASTFQIFESKQGADITFMDMVDERESMGESHIQRMFGGATVFLTGGTGFLGKLMLDKLLRSCPDIRRIYVLARPKKNKDSLKRLQEQFQDVLYERLRKEQPDFMKKLTLVEGDISRIGLGISDADRETLVNEVEFIFHGAATVRFDEAIKTAVEINVRGTREMCLLARSCSKLRAFVHVSTAYSNCPKASIDETFYDSPLPGDKLIDLIETVDAKTLDDITPGLLGDFPNTYAYTKLAAENIVLNYCKGLPVALIRPSIVIGTAKEPIAGWIDNLYGPTGVVVGAAVGLLHALHCRPSAIADLIPGDMVVNACIATAWKVAKDCPKNMEDAPPPDLPPLVYNYVSSVQMPLTWEKFMHYNEVYGLKVPTMQAVYYYVFSLIHNRLLYNLVIFFLHWVPAYIIDGMAILVGKKPMLRKAYTKIHKFSDVISYFSTQSWTFKNDNCQRLFNELCDADKHIFSLDVGSLDWSEYFDTYIKGIRAYLLKDPIDTIPQSLIRYRRLKYIHYMACTVLVICVLRGLWALFNLL